MAVGASAATFERTQIVNLRKKRRCGNSAELFERFEISVVG